MRKVKAQAPVKAKKQPTKAKAADTKARRALKKQPAQAKVQRVRAGTPSKGASAARAGKATAAKRSPAKKPAAATRAVVKKPVKVAKAVKKAVKKPVAAAKRPAPKKVAAKPVRAVAKKPVAKAVAKKVAVKKAVTKKPAAKSVARKPVARAPLRSAAKKAAPKVAAKKAVAKAKPAARPIVKKPAAKPVRAVAKKPVAKAPVKKAVKPAAKAKPVAPKPASKAVAPKAVAPKAVPKAAAPKAAIPKAAVAAAPKVAPKPIAPAVPATVPAVPPAPKPMAKQPNPVREAVNKLRARREEAQPAVRHELPRLDAPPAAPIIAPHSETAVLLRRPQIETPSASARMLAEATARITARRARDMLPVSIVTRRLVLRAPIRGDVPELVKLADNRNIAQWLARLPSPYTRADAIAFVEIFAQRADERAYAITLEGTFIGVVGFTFREGRPPELGYWLGEPYWGQGYMTEAVRGLIDAAHATGLYGLIGARARAENEASIGILEKAGFKRVGKIDIEEHAGEKRKLVSFELEAPRWA